MERLWTSWEYSPGLPLCSVKSSSPFLTQTEVHSFNSFIQPLHIYTKVTSNTYRESKSLPLYIQKLVETMPNSSLDPSRPTNTKKEPIPWRTIPSNDWTSGRIQITLSKMISDHYLCFILPGLSWISLGRNFWKVLKIPALEMTTGARTSTSVCPFCTVTPGNIYSNLY